MATLRQYLFLCPLLMITLFAVIIPSSSATHAQAQSIPPVRDDVNGRHCDTPTWPDAWLMCARGDESISMCAPAPQMPSGLQPNVPVWIATNLDLAEQHIYQWTFTLAFDPGVITIQGISQSHTISEDWDIVYRADQPGQIVVDGTSTTPLTTAGRLVGLDVTIVGTAGAQTELAFSDVAFNDGAIPVMTQDGGMLVLSADRCRVNDHRTVYFPMIHGG